MMANNYAIDRRGQVWDLENEICPIEEKCVKVRGYRQVDEVLELLKANIPFQLIKLSLCADCLCLKKYHERSDFGCEFKSQAEHETILYRIKI